MKYIGQWENGQKNGLGIFTWNDKTNITVNLRRKNDGEGQCFDQNGNLLYKARK